MSNFILVRHGETAWNREKRFHGGRSDVPLSAVGFLQAELMAGALLRENVVTILSSPLVRARQTAEIIGDKLELPIQTVPELVELNFGDYEGALESALRERHGHGFTAWRESNYTQPAPGGDSLYSVRERAAKAVAVIAEKARRGNVAVIAHQAILMAIKAFMHNDYTIEAAESFRQGNDQIEFWDADRRRMVKRLELCGSYAGRIAAADE